MADALTVRGLWEWLVGGPLPDDCLQWAPDVAALTGVLTGR